MDTPKPLEEIFSDVSAEFAELLAACARFREIHEDYRLLLKDFGRLSAAPEHLDGTALCDIGAALSGLEDDAREELRAFQHQGSE
ncbi:hypothetical protein K3727_00035 [Rhodobacteraceae bacterium M382]|nr:hypothetical protein K3727_00035 [Rhodobacteraceae bacterium M382]